MHQMYHVTSLDPHHLSALARMIVAVLPTWLYESNVNLAGMVAFSRKLLKFWKYRWNPLYFSTFNTRPHPLECEDHAFWWPHSLNSWCQVTSLTPSDPNTCHATDATGLSRPQALWGLTWISCFTVSPWQIETRTVAYSTAELLPRPRNAAKWHIMRQNQTIGYLLHTRYNQQYVSTYQNH